MRAQIIRQFGDADIFETDDLPTPPIKPGHVLIKTLATSVNPIDCKIRAGKVPELAPAFPAVLHGDVVGVVEEVGAGVNQLQLHDVVYGFAGGIKGFDGALADYMLVDAALLAKKPGHLTVAEAAALPVVGITAWQALFDRAKLTANQNILIHGGAGGVGHIAVQLAKWVQANVYATVRSVADIELVKKLGADVVINASELDVADYVQHYTNGQGFDVVFDTVGGVNLDRSLQAAKISGTVVAIAARSTHDLSVMHNKNLSLHVVFTMAPLLTGIGLAHYGTILTRIAELADAGHIKPLLHQQQFNYQQVSAAHALLESGANTGKVVLLNANKI